ncbi:MAG TPA: ATP-binding protein [Phycisphaerales bacterium]|nr:ATP-binding protein [Phycisphaerales bacterium]
MVSDSSLRKSLVIESSKSAIAVLCEQLLAEAGDNDFDKDALFAIHLALEEALTNAVVHGNEQDPSKKVEIEYVIVPAKFEITVTDQGGGFAPGDTPDPRIKENRTKPNGRGMLLMQTYMDTVEYNDNGNSVHMVKYKK